MHFEIFVEDQSGKKALDILIPKITGSNNFKVHPYKGVGKIPPNMKPGSDSKKRILLDQLPKLLQGCGRTFKSYPGDCPAAVIVVCDLDKKGLKKFRAELYDVLEKCNPKPRAVFCIAIEEMEAWLLGDLPAIEKAYPKVKRNILSSYVNDSICGTWEKLADAIYPGGAKKLSDAGWQAVGKAKSEWAEKITPHMDIAENKSPSFRYFREKLTAMTRQTAVS